MSKADRISLDLQAKIARRCSLVIKLEALRLTPFSEMDLDSFGGSGNSGFKRQKGSVRIWGGPGDYYPGTRRGTK